MKLVYSLCFIRFSSWFAVDIKLGVISIIFTQENVFSNVNDFDAEFLEKVLDRTNSFTKLVQLDFKFSETNSHSPLNTSTLNRTMNSRSSDKFTSHSMSNTMPSSMKKGKNINMMDSSGYSLIKMIFSEYGYNIIKKYMCFYEQYFYDTRGYLKSEMMKFDFFSNSDNNLQINQFFVFSTLDISVGPYFEDLSSKFKIPSFLKEIINVVSYKVLILFF